jgi:hypothetical protein
MQRFLCLWVLLVLGFAFHVQAAEHPPKPMNKERLLSQLARLRPFMPERGMPEKGRSRDLSKDHLRQGMRGLPRERVDRETAGYVGGAIFLFNGGRQILAVMQWKTHGSAARFMKVENELLRLKDKTPAYGVVQSTYRFIPITKSEKALICRKTLQRRGRKHQLTTFVAVRKTCLLEGNFLARIYEDQTLRGIIADIWKAVQEGKGTRSP